MINEEKFLEFQDFLYDNIFSYKINKEYIRGSDKWCSGVFKKIINKAYELNKKDN